MHYSTFTATQIGIYIQTYTSTKKYMTPYVDIRTVDNAQDIKAPSGTLAMFSQQEDLQSTVANTLRNLYL